MRTGVLGVHPKLQAGIPGSGLCIAAEPRRGIWCVQANDLIAAGVQPNVVDADKRGGAHFAAARGELEVLKLLHSKGVDIDAEDTLGRAPLHYAALHNHESVIVFLEAKSAWIDACDATDCSALHLAARSGSDNAAVRLVMLGASAQLRNQWDLTALGVLCL